MKAGDLMAGVCYGLMLAIVIVVSAGLISAGCATGKAALAEGVVAFIECEDGHLDAQALADMKTTASAELRHLIAGKAAPDTAALKADLAPLKSDLARCGWAAAIAGLGVLLHPTPGVAVSALVELGPDPAQVRAAFAVAARANGWPAVKLASGDVL